MSWERFNKYYLAIDTLGFSLDISRMKFADTYLGCMDERIEDAFEAMEALEKGAIANPDEQRMVGHYWLRDPDRAPSSEIGNEIRECLDRIRAFTQQVHAGQIQGSGGAFTDLLIIGIGGSALGPQFVSQALGTPSEDKLTPHFFDNTDPDGMDLVLDALGDRLKTTLAIVISKSGSTPETRNGMLEAEVAWKRAGLDFSKHAVAITGNGSKLDQYAVDGEWLARFPMWDWVGGRTSELAAVGLLPAALQGLNIDDMLEGAREMDQYTRSGPAETNPAALLALMWYYGTNGKGEKDMVILPYKDRLMLFSKYLQQLIMESLGKEKDLHGQVVHQGIAVYGNKGSTDQHAYVQQLREGVLNFFVTFIEVLEDRSGDSIEVGEGTTSGDFLQGFYLGTRDALYENGRESITITIEQVDARRVGALIALYERAVGLYASLIGINAYHQPGVEAGKKAAAATLELAAQVLAGLEKLGGEAVTAAELAEKLGLDERTELIFKLLEHMAVNVHKPVDKTPGANPNSHRYRYQR